MEKNKRYPADFASETWAKDGMTFYLVKHSGLGHWCGYVEFTQRPCKQDGYWGILTYVPVHGGITYAEPTAVGGMVYGFDCNHWHDEHNPDLTSIPWLKAECERMGEAIKIAGQWEEFYSMAKDNDARANVIDAYMEALEVSFDVTANLGIMINVLCGCL